MKPFNLEEALQGKPVQLRTGAKAFVIKKLVNPICAYEALIGYQLINDNEYENVLTWSEEGARFEDCEDYLDIVGMWEDPPRLLTLGGKEFPAPEREPLADDTRYYYPCPHLSDKWGTAIWQGVEFDEHRLISGQVHLTKEAAVAHAEALIYATIGAIYEPYEE